MSRKLRCCASDKLLHCDCTGASASCSEEVSLCQGSGEAATKEALSEQQNANAAMSIFMCLVIYEYFYGQIAGQDGDIQMATLMFLRVLTIACHADDDRRE